jgi:hypothetical protein
MIAKLIILIGKICLSPKSEVISVSNLFNSKIQRKVRSNFKYKTNCYVRFD